MGHLLKIYVKTRGKPWENHGKSMEHDGETRGISEKHTLIELFEVKVNDSEE